ncbi:reverse transcriptase [Hamiltosporidium tvaerminnensis]|uniref:Reverse transcriptase n=1 Tax=Hamiltosporidium tvaerminnensis TaxID=1176355 RepID=A0A4Q9LVW8_9MICR|nr:reverse transcriptase [Hamiltosporidium tvaerminnensis]
MFELFRGRFYRRLSELLESEHVVSRDKIVSFWSTMWNKNDDTVTYDDYLIPFVSDNHPTTFPSLDQFVNIINWLSNWKAAGIDGSDYRPITCMSNLYKLTTKCVTKVVQLEVERRGLLAENQLGAVRGVQGAKEQALLNIALNKEYGNNLKATWIDVKKAYDSIDHAYLTQCIENLNLPDWILKFIKVIISKWKIDISRILQGDSLSPLLFVLCMDPLSRKLNEKYTKVTVQTDAEFHSTNHLLFIDDLKLLAKDSSTLSAMTGEAKEFLEVIGLEINREKSATNDTCCEDTDTLLEGVSVYKYLGIIEDSRGIPTRSSFEEVQSALISRVERLFHTRLNAKNLFSAINQHAISLINYDIGVFRLEPADFSKLDDAVRAVLVKNKIHLRPGCKERLYLPRTELGRGLHRVELRSEHMLLQLLDCLEKSKEISTRRVAILKVENTNKTHLALIKGFYNLEEAQLAKLYNEIEKRNYIQSYIMQEKMSLWLKRGNIRPRNEAVFCYIQDRNVFWGADGVCQHCGKSGKTVDHLATRCEKMLGHDYTRRHNEVLRCLHLLLLNRCKSHSVQEILDNEYAEKKNNITLIEVGITSQDSLQIVETEKLRKYDLLANELGLIYKCSVEITPYVITWDGIVTKYHESHLKRLEMPMNVEAYIQSIVLKKTVETISFDRRRGLESGLNAEESWERASMGVIMRSEMHEEPIPPLKEAKTEEDGAKNFKPKYKAPFILQGGTTLEEPTNNINEESDLE